MADTKKERKVSPFVEYWRRTGIMDASLFPKPTKEQREDILRSIELESN